jgi:hypothetical protein
MRIKGLRVLKEEKKVVKGEDFRRQTKQKAKEEIKQNKRNDICNIYDNRIERRLLLSGLLGVSFGPSVA